MAAKREEGGQLSRDDGGAELNRNPCRYLYVCKAERKHGTYKGATMAVNLEWQRKSMEGTRASEQGEEVKWMESQSERRVG